MCIGDRASETDLVIANDAAAPAWVLVAADGALRPPAVRSRPLPSFIPTRPLQPRCPPATSISPSVRRQPSTPHVRVEAWHGWRCSEVGAGQRPGPGLRPASTALSSCTAIERCSGGGNRPDLASERLTAARWMSCGPVHSVPTRLKRVTGPSYRSASAGADHP